MFYKILIYTLAFSLFVSANNQEFVNLGKLAKPLEKSLLEYDLVGDWYFYSLNSKDNYNHFAEEKSLNPIRITIPKKINGIIINNTNIKKYYIYNNNISIGINNIIDQKNYNNAMNFKIIGTYKENRYDCYIFKLNESFFQDDTSGLFCKIFK